MPRKKNNFKVLCEAINKKKVGLFILNMNIEAGEEKNEIIDYREMRRRCIKTL